MTPKERLEKIISKDSLKMRMARFKYGNGEPRLFAHEELIKLPVDFSVGRKTPKSELLKELEKRSSEYRAMTDIAIKQQQLLLNGGMNGNAFRGQAPISREWRDMLSIYTGSDLGHFTNTDRK